jgi:probable HAF family extracellular repeat protein
VHWTLTTRGQVVGSSYLSNGEEHPFLWQSGTRMQDLGTRGFPSRINNNGQVVGHSFLSGNAFLWQQETGMQDLGRLGGSTSAAWGIDDNGQVTGTSTTIAGRWHVFLWDSETGMQDLGAGSFSAATSINNSGQVVGWFNTSSGRKHALWQKSTGIQDIGELISTDVTNPYSINNNGQIVGSTNGHAFLYEDGQMLDLNLLVSTDSGWLLGAATGINDLGQIVGTGDYRGQGRAFLLTPVPEPTGYALCGAALIGAALLMMHRSH